MRHPILAAAAAALLGFTTPALATAPILSGAYILTINSTCQPTLTADFTDVNGAPRTDALSLSSEEVAQQLYSVEFNPSTRKVRTTGGYIDLMSPFLLTKTGSQSGTTGTAPVEYSATIGAQRYSNTATSLKFGGLEFHAIYGQVDSSGIAHVVSLIGVPIPNGPCMFSGQAIRR
jgi:hypothetical protein